jgi:hypothetical protein
MEAFWKDLEEAAGWPAADTPLAKRISLDLNSMLVRDAKVNATMHAAFKTLHKDPYANNTVWMLPALASYPCGGCSPYPCKSGGDGHNDRDAGLYNPNVLWYAEAARKAQVDFRVVYLYRPMDELLLTNCVRDPIEQCDDMAKTMSLTGRKLAAQLRGLPPSSAFCVRYGELEQMAQALQVAVGRGLEADGVMRRGWAPSGAAAQGCNTAAGNECDTGGPELGPNLAEELADADSDLEDLCNSLDPTSGSEHLIMKLFGLPG